MSDNESADKNDVLAKKDPDPSKHKSSKDDSQAGSSSTTPTPYIRVEVPTLPNFSGEGKGVQSSYTHWHYQLAYYIEDLNISRSSIWQAVHKSVKGPAADVLVHLGHNATLDTLIQKFDTLFGST